MRLKKGYVVTDDDQFYHRVVYRQAHGKIPDGWVIHHIDCNKLNNSLRNLIALPEKMHNTIHQLPCLPSRASLEQMVEKFKLGLRPDKQRLLVEKAKKDLKKKPKRYIRYVSGTVRRREAEMTMSKEVGEFIKDNPDKVKRYGEYDKI